MEGSGKMVVTAVGMNSQAGIIVALLGATTHELDNSATTAADNAGKHRTCLYVYMCGSIRCTRRTYYTYDNASFKRLQPLETGSKYSAVNTTCHCLCIWVVECRALPRTSPCPSPGHFPLASRQQSHPWQVVAEVHGDFLYIMPHSVNTKLLRQIHLLF